MTMHEINRKDVCCKPNRVLGLATLVCALFIPHSHAFSSHHSHPWEIPQLQTTSHVHHDWRTRIITRKPPPETERRPWSRLQAFTSISSVEGFPEGTTLKHDEELQNREEHMTLHKDEHPTNSTPSAVFEALSEELQGSHSVRKLWRPLLAMCRPANFAGLLLFHLLGTKVAIERIPNVAFTARTVARPSMSVVLIALVVTNAASMLVNDYYDAKSGVDAKKPNKPLVDGEVPMEVAKRFITGLYACLMVLVAVIPGIPARLTVVFAGMMTFWYTKHLKPITWLKNGVCALLVALSPFASAAAASQLISGEQWGILKATKLWRLAAMLFFGFLGREMVMDCNDVKDDKLHEVLTVPVVYGRRFASAFSLGCILVMGLLSVAGANSIRQISLAASGGLILLFRHWQVFRTDGSDPDVVHQSIEEGKSTILLLLASYV